MPIWVGWTIAAGVLGWALRGADDAAEGGAQLLRWAAVLMALWLIAGALRGRG